MDLKTKHLKEKKRVSFTVSMVIMLVMLLFSVYKLLFFGFGLLNIIRAALVVLPLIFIIIVRLSMMNKKGSEMFFTYSQGLAYAAVFLTSVDDGYLYAFMFPIVILVLIFQETKKALIGSAAAIRGAPCLARPRAHCPRCAATTSRRPPWPCRPAGRTRWHPGRWRRHSVCRRRSHR